MALRPCYHRECLPAAQLPTHRCVYLASQCQGSLVNTAGGILSRERLRAAELVFLSYFDICFKRKKDHTLETLYQKLCSVQLINTTPLCLYHPEQNEVCKTAFQRGHAGLRRLQPKQLCGQKCSPPPEGSPVLGMTSSGGKLGLFLLCLLLVNLLIPE